MSEAVKHVLKLLEGIELHDDWSFRGELLQFMSNLSIKQGDYHVIELAKKGLLVRFGKKEDKDPTDAKKLFRYDKKKYTENMLELLKGAIKGTEYRVAVRSLTTEWENVPDEFKMGAEDKKEFMAALESLPPAFDFYSGGGELLATLQDGCDFWLKQNHYDEATELMEKIGRRVFECKEGKLWVNRSMIRWGDNGYEESRQRLINWKPWSPPSQ